MKDVTATSFGFVIAYLIPGLVGLYGLSFWYEPLRKMFDTFLTAQSNIGLFLLVLLATLAAGLVAHGLRYVLFEKVLSWIGGRLKDEDFRALSEAEKREAFLAAVDQEYRYHQFWGGLFVVAPIGVIGGLRESWSTLDGVSAFVAGGVCAVFWLLFFYIAVELQKRYIKRISAILTTSKGA